VPSDHETPSPTWDHRFDTATAVTPHGDGTLYDLDLDPGFAHNGRPNGGYMMAAMARAVAMSVGLDGAHHPDPLSSSAVFLRPPEVGPASVVVEVLRTGRTASQARATLLQGDRTCVETLYIMGRLDAAGAPDLDQEPPADLPPEAACVPMPAERPGVAEPVSTSDVTDIRLDPAAVGFAAGRPGGRADIRGWVRFGDGREPDPLALLYVADVLPPATFELGSLGWVPTLELTVYVRARPRPGSLRVRQWARLVRQGMVDERCEVWDAGGRLVAEATQLALVRMPPPAN
jgi:acyl-coenzyme A thioesterase PaaI-like protein